MTVVTVSADPYRAMHLAEISTRVQRAGDNMRSMLLVARIQRELIQ
jgi:hypothetical protein